MCLIFSNSSPNNEQYNAEIIGSMQDSFQKSNKMLDENLIESVADNSCNSSFEQMLCPSPNRSQGPHRFNKHK